MADAALSYYVVGHYVVAASAAHNRRAADLIENVSRDLCTAHEVVEIHAMSVGTLGTVLDMVDIVAANNCPPISPVAARVDSSSIAGELTDSRNVVILNDVIISLDQDCLMGQFIDQVIFSQISAAAVEIDCRMVGPIDATGAVNAAVCNKVISGGQRGPRATRQNDAVLTAVHHLALVKAVI